MKYCLLAILLVHNCREVQRPVEYQDGGTVDTGADSATEIVEDYPCGPYGMGIGNTMPAAVLYEAHDQPMQPADVYADQPAAYWVLILSIEGCQPCERYWERRGEIWAHLDEAEDESLLIDKVTGTFGHQIDWVYPTTVVVDIATMRVVQRVNGSFQDFGFYLRQLEVPQ